MKASAKRWVVTNELILTLKVGSVRGRRRLAVDISNCARRDLPFLRSIAAVVAAWYSRP